MLPRFTASARRSRRLRRIRRLHSACPTTPHYDMERLEPRTLLAVGPTGQFLVNFETQSNQLAPAIAADADGDLVVAWQSTDQDGSGYGIYAQRYSAAGEPRGAEFRVNVTTLGRQEKPSLAVDADGNFVVAWINWQDGSGEGIYARRYLTDGTPAGGEFAVNTTTLGDQRDPSVAMADNGEFVIAWGSRGAAPNVHARRFSADGAARGDDFLVNNQGISWSDPQPAAAMDDDGDFVIAWRGRVDVETPAYGIYAQRFNAAGAALDHELLVTGPTSTSHANPAVAMDVDGDFVVAWEGYVPGGSGIYARRYAAGATDGAPFRIDAEPPAYARNPSLAMEANGGFVIAWHGARQSWSDQGISARRFTAAGQPIGDLFRVSDPNHQSVERPSVTAQPGGGFVVAWNSHTDQGGHDISAQRYHEIPQPASIGNLVWNDLNGNGVQEPGEPGVDGAAVNLFRDGRFLNSTVTIGGGLYQIENILPGEDFHLEVRLPSGFFAFSPPDQGVDDALDSDIDPQTARSARFPLAPNQVDLRHDAGILAPASIRGVKFNDRDADGVRDSGEEGLPGWTMYLDVDADAQLDPQETSTTTDSTGQYQFSLLLAGAHRVRAASQPDWAPTAPTNGARSVVLASGQELSGVDFASHTHVPDVVAGPIGSEFRVNATPSAALPSDPDVASDADGDFVVVWHGRRDDASDWDVWARRYDTAGQPLGSEFVVNATVPGSQQAPSVAMEPDGDFIVAWQSAPRDGSDWDVYARRYNAAGQPLAGEFRVNATTAGDQWAPSVAVNAAGQFVIAWQSNLVVFSQRFDAAAAPLGAEQEVGGFVREPTPAVAIDADGDFVIAWDDLYHVSARRYDAAGSPQGERLQLSVPGYTPRYPLKPAVAMNAAGEFVISAVFKYRGGGTGCPLCAADPEADHADAADADESSVGIAGLDRDGVYAQRYDAAGQTVGPVLRVAPANGSYSPSSSVAMDGNGDMVVAWNGYDNRVFAQRFAASGPAPGPLIAVNAAAPGGEELALAMGTGGGLIVAWDGIYLRRFGADGQPLAAESNVNTLPADVTSPAVAAHRDGNFVVAWESLGQDGSAWGIYAQRYDAAGQPRGGEFLVNTFVTGHQMAPTIAAADDGAFVIAWESLEQDGSGWGVYAQRYDSSGQPSGGEFRVNTTTAHDQRAPTLAMDAAGNFVVAWESQHQGEQGSLVDVHLQRYSAAGVAQGPESRVNVTAGHYWVPSLPAVAMDADGDFVVVWRDVSPAHYGGYARRYDAAGQPIGDEFRVTAAGYTHSVAMDADGDFIVAWNEYHYSYIGGSWTSGHARRYSAAGQPIGGDFLGNDPGEGPRSDPAVAMDADGDFVITYGSQAVYARRYNRAGVLQGGTFPVNIAATPTPAAPAVAMTPVGDFVVAYRASDGGASGIYARRYGVTPAPRVTQVFVAGTGWTPEFRNFLADTGLGESRFGYAIPAGAGQLNVLPWTNIDQLSVRFSHSVVASDHDLSVAGLNLAEYAVTGFAYDASTRTATWTLAQPLGKDRVLLDLDGDDGGVSGVDGRRLDGEWSGPQPSGAYPFASGDGSPGGDFLFRLNILPGDVNRSGAVLANDFSNVKKKFFSTAVNPGAGDAAYSVFHDLDGSGTILASDFADVKKRFFNRLPDAGPAASAAALFADTLLPAARALTRALLRPSSGQARRGVLEAPEPGLLA